MSNSLLTFMHKVLPTRKDRAKAKKKKEAKETQQVDRRRIKRNMSKYDTPMGRIAKDTRKRDKELEDIMND